MAKPSPYLRERIINYRAKKLSYEKIRLVLVLDKFVLIPTVYVQAYCRYMSNSISSIRYSSASTILQNRLQT